MAMHPVLAPLTLSNPDNSYYIYNKVYAFQI